ncbi:MAG TPA: 4Fe-4S dicluster domain-containing protein [Armatimonadota bacterium]|jgi:polyferredoxin
MPLHARARRTTAHRARLQWLLWIAVPLVIIGGQFHPYLGFIVPVAMVTGMLSGAFRGRWACGWICPRGGFLERFMARLSFRRRVPGLLRGYGFRWPVFAALMSFMVYRISLQPDSAAHWGAVFVSMCAITTGIGLLLGVLYQPRAWCAICPVGTFAGAVGGHKHALTIAEGCVSCRRCEKVCPLNLEIAKHAEAGVLENRDCVHCHECIKACPKQLLDFDRAA